MHSQPHQYATGCIAIMYCSCTRGTPSISVPSLWTGQGGRVRCSSAPPRGMATRPSCLVRACDGLVFEELGLNEAGLAIETCVIRPRYPWVMDPRYAWAVHRSGAGRRRLYGPKCWCGETHRQLPPAGIVSCLAFTPDGAALAAGTYTGSIGIFDPRTRGLQLILQGHRGGLTQVGGWCVTVIVGSHEGGPTLCNRLQPFSP